MTRLIGFLMIAVPAVCIMYALTFILGVWPIVILL